MSRDPEKPVRYGITPAALWVLGPVMVVVVASTLPKLLDLVRWLVRWWNGG
jgi:hypothetical protein